MRRWGVSPLFRGMCLGQGRTGTYWGALIPFLNGGRLDGFQSPLQC